MNKASDGGTFQEDSKTHTMTISMHDAFTFSFLLYPSKALFATPLLRNREAEKEREKEKGAFLDLQYRLTHTEGEYTKICLFCTYTA